MRKTPRALAVTTCLLLAPLGAAAREPVKSLSEDLNGDGRKDAATLKWKEGDSSYVLQLGTSRLQGRGDEVKVEGLTVIDLDTSDKRKELLVHVELPWDERRIDLYGFDGAQLKHLGSVPTLTQAHGNGIFLSDDWWGFWNRRDKYVLDRERWKVERVPQDLYYVGEEARVTTSFPLTFDRSGKDVVAQLATNTKIRVLAADTSIPGKLPWFLVKSSTGLVGWAEGEALTHFTDGLPLHE